jgi:hypothetical protein
MTRTGTERDRGVAMIEFAIIATFLLLMLSAVVDLGLAWRRSNEVSSTLRSATRVASNFGADGAADFQALTSLNAGVAEIGNANVNRVIVYRSETADGDVPDDCLDETPSASGTGIDTPTVKCNVYSRQQLASLSASNFTTSGAASCPNTAHDRWFCPAEREADQGDGADYVGIWMEVEYTYVVGMLPGGGITIKDKTVMRIEPAVS